jgi:hypothetical protein
VFVSFYETLSWLTLRLPSPYFGLVCVFAFLRDFVLVGFVLVGFVFVDFVLVDFVLVDFVLVDFVLVDFAFSFAFMCLRTRSAISGASWKAPLL